MSESFYSNTDPIIHVEVHQSSSYSSFLPHPYNREICKAHVKNLAEDMKENGFKKDFPILINRTNFSEPTIICGHHRILAAEAAEVPFYYAFTEETEPQKEKVLAWKTKDYLGVFIKQGNENYIRIQEWITKTKMPSSFVPRILTGDYHANRKKLLDGALILTQEDRELLDKTEDIFLELDNLLAIEIRKSSNLLIGIIGLIKAGLYDKEKFHEKFALQTSQDKMIRSRLRNIRDAIVLIESIVNFRTTNRVSLMFQYSEFQRKEKRRYI